MKELTGFNFNEVYQLPIMEFFTYVAYCHYKAKKQEQQLRELKAKTKRR